MNRLETYFNLKRSRKIFKACSKNQIITKLITIKVKSSTLKSVIVIWQKTPVEVELGLNRDLQRNLQNLKLKKKKINTLSVIRILSQVTNPIIHIFFCLKYIFFTSSKKDKQKRAKR